jgi:hypothetical protein
VSPGRLKVEHDDAARVAQLRGRPLREVLSLAETEARRQGDRFPPTKGDGTGDGGEPA